MVVGTVPIALELYTVRDETAKDFSGTLRRVAEIGYRAVELAGYGGLEAREMASLLRELGVEAAATHVSMDRLGADLNGEIEYCKTIGCEYLVVPSVPQARRGIDAIAAVAGQLNEWGETCRREGLVLGYHNHDWEFAVSDGRTPMEVLVEGTDTDLVVLELDLYWVAYAGIDPANFLREHADRVRLVHLKDLAPDRTYTEVGEGTLDLQGLYRQAAEIGVRWAIVEHDAPTMPSLESARLSLQNIQRWT